VEDERNKHVNLPSLLGAATCSVAYGSRKRRQDN
jgi:hypothetical protein